MLLHEKAEQAQKLLRESGLDCWLTFVRETDLHPDPGIEMVVGAGVVRNSAFLFGVNGERIAIAANFDTSNIRATGVFHEVIGYDEDIKSTLLSALQRINPRHVGLNFSSDDQTADGLTHGHWLLINELLRETPFANRLTSAGPLLGQLRGRKSPTEIARIRSAIGVTEDIVAQLTPQIRPGASEKDLAEFVRQQFAARGLTPAWHADSCPIVNSGPASDLGHCTPSPTIKVEPGHLVHIDLGVKREGFCSDLQRMWYVRRPGETAPPPALCRAFSDCVRAIDAAAAVLKPGVKGHEVDAAARQMIVAAGHPEYKHGTGHGLGRAVHDGGTMLGPRWPCYGRMPDGVVETGNVFTLELGVVTGAGYIGLEEDVLVTERGCEFLSTFNRELTLI